LALLLALGGCEQHAGGVAEGGVARSGAGKPKPKPSAAVAPPLELADDDDAMAPEPSGKGAHKPPAPHPESEKDDKPIESSRYVFDGSSKLGPAAPVAAHARGVVMVTRTDEIELLKLPQPLSKSKKSVPGSIEPTGRGPQEFWPVARGPGVSATHVYWVSKDRVVRRAISGSDLEILATDAREGTRVAVSSSPDVVAYITKPQGKQDSLARLILPDGKQLVVTPEGAAASSISLARVGEDVIVSYIDGRSGMTPVHARRLHLKAGTLDPDVVVWVSGATQGLTEINSVAGGNGSWLLLPVERDASHFGLATLAVERDPKMDPPLRWRTYANGLDLSPAAATTLCGAPTAIYVRPIDEKPGSDQELMLSGLTLDDTASSEQLATARGFADVSLYGLPEGALLAYVADRHTWARVIRCK
jgi:hypothetical protein